MSVTAKAEYACLAMLELAARYDDPRPVRLAEMADKHAIPQRFLVQILLQMKTAGLLRTTRGSAGGYQLAKRPEAITLADIFRVLARMDEPEDATAAARSALAAGLQKVWKGLADVRAEYLTRFTLRDLLPTSAGADYVI